LGGYDDFTLGLQVGSGGHIWVSAASRLGHVHGVTSVAPGENVLPDLFEQLYDVMDAIRFAEPFDVGPLTHALGDIAFGEPVVSELFQAARGAAADRGNQLVVRIQASPHLAALPWELLPDPTRRLGSSTVQHLTLTPDVHVVRLSRGRTYPLSTEPVLPPLNLLVVMSSPMGEGPGDDALTFDIYEAKRNLLGELLSLQDGGWLNIDIEDRPSMDNLRRRIGSKRRGYHLLHYLGHAEPNKLVLENNLGRSQPVLGDEVVQWLQSSPNLRLVTFTGCETARPGGDPSLLAGTNWQDLLSLAERAAQGSAPVVLGMQAVLPFRTEWVLTRSLYQALASGNTIVDALRLAREAVRADGQERVPVALDGEGRRPAKALLDWAIPSLFLNSAEPTPVLDRSGSPPVGTRRRSNVAKLRPPTAGVGLIGRDVPLRQAVEVLVGHTRERLLLISGMGGVRGSELLDRALEEIDGEVSDILAIPYPGLNDAAEAHAFLAESERAGAVTTSDLVVRANLCAAVSQFLQRTDERTRDRQRDWTLQRWWTWLTEDLATRHAVIAIDGMAVLSAATEPMRVLADAWLADTFSSESSAAFKELEGLVEQLRDPVRARQREKCERLLAEFDDFIDGPAGDPVAREIVAEQAEELLNERLRHRPGWPVDAATSPGDSIVVTPEAVARSRADLRAARNILEALADMIVRLVRRSSTCRVALVVDELPEGLLREVDDLVFPIRLGEVTWPEMWRWIRRNLPGLVKFGQERLKDVWSKYLGSDPEFWTDLERRIAAGGLHHSLSPVADVRDLREPASDLENVALQVCSRRTRKRSSRPPTGARRVSRRDRPLVIAAAGSLEAGHADQDHQRLPYSLFQARLNQLADEHGIGGRASAEVADQDTLAVLVSVPSPFRSGASQLSDMVEWCRDVGASQPDIVLLDFGMPAQEEPEALRLARRYAFPSYRTLQVAAGGNSGELPEFVPEFPAWDDEVLAVGALDETGRIRSFSTRNGKDRKPDIFATDIFDPGRPLQGTTYSAAYAVVAAILAWTLLPERTPRGLRRFLIECAVPIDAKTKSWPRRLDLDEVLAAARRERVLKTLGRGRASLQAIVAMTGITWRYAEMTLNDLEERGRVASAPVGRDILFELLEDEPSRSVGRGQGRRR